jgi:hypothetical protein
MSGDLTAGTMLSPHHMALAPLLGRRLTVGGVSCRGRCSPRSRNWCRHPGVPLPTIPFAFTLTFPLTLPLVVLRVPLVPLAITFLVVVIIVVRVVPRISLVTFPTLVIVLTLPAPPPRPKLPLPHPPYP